MENSIYYYLGAALALGLIPIVPQMIRLRIIVLRFLHLRWLADWHERNIRVFTIGVRAFFGAMAITLAVLGLTE